jgi:peptidoglycan/LPS O-acetylase OafA/YrhL
MFGIWRTLLAVEVVAHHLLQMPIIGFYAVFSFFVLSGFLMTAIVHGTYGYTAGGFARYMSNRALRLLPSYWFAVIVSLVLVAGFGGDTVSRFNLAIAVPPSIGSWAENLSMVFWNWIPKEQTPRLVPPTWALTVEICYYVLIGVGASRTKLTTVIWIAASLIYVIVIRRLHPEGGPYLYEAIPAGSLPFSVGALAWHYRDAIRDTLDRLRIGNPLLLIVARLLLYAAIVVVQAQTGWKWLTMLGNWLNIAISALIVCTLFATKGTPSMRRLDKAIGDFSYPIYLLHLQMGLVAAMILSGQPKHTGADIFALGLILTILVSTVSARAIDPTVDRWRRRIKPR